MTFVISGGDAEGTAFRKRSEFVFERPLSAKSIRNTLKPAYGLILRERRRYFRCPVSIPVTILRQSMPEVHCHSVNISEGGMALSTFVPLIAGEDVQVQFTLPDHESALLGRIDNLLVENRAARCSLCVYFGGIQVRITGWLSAKTGRDASGIRGREVSQIGPLPTPRSRTLPTSRPPCTSTPGSPAAHARQGSSPIETTRARASSVSPPSYFRQTEAHD